MAEVLVAGVGAIGGWLLGRLTEGGADVEGLARGDTLARLGSGEHLVLRSHQGDWSGPVRVVADGLAGAPYDWVLVCTKVHQTDELVALLADDGGTWVSVQNGIEGPAILARHHQPVAAAVVYSGCRKVDPVTVSHTANGFLVTDDEAVAAFLAGHGVSCRLVEDLRPVQWRKLMGNVVENSLTALLRTTVGPLHTGDELEPVIDAALAEVAAVGRAEGIDLPGDVVTSVHDALRSLPPGNGTSTLYDALAGRPLEVDALTGAVVRLAGRHGVPVPTVRTLDALLRFVSSRAPASEPLRR